MFETILMGDGQITPSAYDTAWVARVPAIDGSVHPQFPATLQWLLQNQLNHGSWGLQSHFLISDRLLNTLSSILTLTAWNTGNAHIHQGLECIRRSAQLLDAESRDNFPMNFEIMFPALLEEAKLVGLSLPYDLPCFNSLWMYRKEKLASITTDTVHSPPTLLLYSLEGVQDMINWNKILELECKDDSFLGSPSSTACVLMHTRDDKCLGFLTRILSKFDNCVPCVYPIDLLQCLLMVDNVERLGIDRHFQKEIKVVLDYVYRYWNEKGIDLGKERIIGDLNTNALGLRTLRLHRYNVSSAYVLENFKDENREFFCSIGHSRRDVRSMLNLYRASHVAFPEEKIMEDARIFTTEYLQKALTKCEVLSDKNLSTEIKYALEYPWKCSVPRWEARNHIDVYGTDDAWLHKNLFRMSYVSNQKILELARLDFNIVQSQHQIELKLLSRLLDNMHFFIGIIQSILIKSSVRYNILYLICNIINRWWIESGMNEVTIFKHRHVEFLSKLLQMNVDYISFWGECCRWDVSVTDCLLEIMRI
eukprot:Gb_39147 [translate_table: standard]